MITIKSMTMKCDGRVAKLVVFKTGPVCACGWRRVTARSFAGLLERPACRAWQRAMTDDWTNLTN